MEAFVKEEVGMEDIVLKEESFSPNDTKEEDLKMECEEIKSKNFILIFFLFLCI